MKGKAGHTDYPGLLKRLTEEQKDCIRRMTVARPAYFALREVRPLLALIKLDLCNKVINGVHLEGYGLQVVLTPAGLELAALMAAEEEKEENEENEESGQPGS